MAKDEKYMSFDRTDRQLRALCWLYIFLLIMEGALRKWALPSFSDQLLLVRDPLVLVAYLIALDRKRFPLNKYVISGIALMVLSVATTFLFGHENLKVAVFGVRTNFLHIPFAFIMGSVFYRTDVIRIGRWWLWGTLLMTVIIALQFSSPQSAWINQGVGGVEGAGFSGALGRYRPPGTFSFITGILWFYTFSFAFLVSGLMQHKNYSKLLLSLASISIFIAVPVSISRSLILCIGLTLVVGMLASTFQKGVITRYFRIIAIAIVGLFIASQISIFDEAKEAFLERWEQSTNEDMGGVKGAIFERTLNEFIGPFIMKEDVPFFGKGLGAGTQAGAHMLTGDRGFDLGEGEWFRITGESGIFIGGLFIAWRIWITLALLDYGLAAFRRGNGMGLIFISAAGYNLILGQLGQTTVQGFTIIGLGLTIAAMRRRKTIATQSDEPITAES